tara:strand:- start:2071 stop:2991 length:921 start_codon:yes stop_codon:yes gene_type:complete
MSKVVDMDILQFLPEQQPLVFEKHKFIYQPITKVACKTIKTWMISLSNEDMINKIGESEFGKIIESNHINEPDFNIHDYSCKMFGHVEHKSDDFVDGKPLANTDGKKILMFNREYIKVCNALNFEFHDKFKNHFKFIFVRNPWVRVISSYLDKFRNRDGLLYLNAIRLNNFHYGESVSDRILSFENFVDVLYHIGFVQDYSAHRYHYFDIHWLPQHLIHDAYIKDFDFVGKIENFNEDFDKITERLNIKIKANYNLGYNPNLHQKYHKFYESNLGGLNINLVDKVAKIYKEDIERYGYDFSDLDKK